MQKLINPIIFLLVFVNILTFWFNRNEELLHSTIYNELCNDKRELILEMVSYGNTRLRNSVLFDKHFLIDIVTKVRNNELIEDYLFEINESLFRDYDNDTLNTIETWRKELFTLTYLSNSLSMNNCWIGMIEEPLLAIDCHNSTFEHIYSWKLYSISDIGDIIYYNGQSILFDIQVKGYPIPISDTIPESISIEDINGISYKAESINENWSYYY